MDERVVKELLEEFIGSYKSMENERRSTVVNLKPNSNWPDSDYFNIVSAVYSARIEGNSIDLNSFINHNQFFKKF